MKIRLTLFFVSIILTDISFAQTSKSIQNSEIDEVKVFLNGAQVSRSSKLQLEAGLNELSFEGLSANIDKQSILATATVNGGAEVTILSVLYQLNYLKGQQKTPEIKHLEDSLEVLTRQLTQFQNTQSVYQEEQSMILANKSIGGQNVGLSVETLEKTANFFRNRLSDIKNRMEELGVKEKKLNEEKDKITRQLSVLNAKRNKPSGSILINLSSSAKASVIINLSYVVSNAGWNPFYDIRVKDITSPVQLSYKANVYQNTGEDWKEVKLKLSTGNPTQNGTKPQLNTWVIDFAQPIRYAAPLISRDKNASGVSRSMEAAPAMEEMNYSSKVKSVADFTQVNQNQLSTDFDIAIPYSVPSDGKNYLVDVQSYSIPGEFSYYAVPKIDKDAFLLAKVTGWEKLNLLPGQANIYFEGSYVGESFINTENTNDTLDFSLGRDKRIIISREQLKDYSETKLFSSKVEKIFTYEISVRNTKKDIVSIQIEDQLPLSKDKDIEVKLIESSGGSLNNETGKLSWKLTLKANETLKKRLSFSVKYPANKSVQGL